MTNKEAKDIDDAFDSLGKKAASLQGSMGGGRRGGVLVAMTPQNERGWEHEFYERWYLHHKTNTYEIGKYAYITVGDEVKDFIREVEEAAEQRGRDAAVNCIRNHKHSEEAIKGLWYVTDKVFEAARHAPVEDKP